LIDLGQYLKKFFIDMYHMGIVLPIERNVFEANDMITSQTAESVKPELQHLASQILGDDKPEAVYQTLIEIFNTLLSQKSNLLFTTPIKTQATQELAGTPRTEMMKQVQRHWQTPLYGNNVEKLLLKLAAHEKEFPSRGHYAKVLVLLQSSGAGKSRLANEIGLHCPMVTYVIRDHQGGFPQRDRDILSYFLSSPSKDEKETMMSPHKPVGTAYEDISERSQNIWYHALAVGILQSTFEKCKLFSLFNPHTKSITHGQV
jgi:hypothetical protein